MNTLAHSLFHHSYDIYPSHFAQLNVPLASFFPFTSLTHPFREIDLNGNYVRLFFF
jgi:hypothetical protein